MIYFRKISLAFYAGLCFGRSLRLVSLLGHPHPGIMSEQSERITLLSRHYRTSFKFRRESFLFTVPIVRTRLCNYFLLPDLYPALCGLTGTVSPHETSGKSLAPLLNDVSIPGKAHEMMMLKPHIYAVRTPTYRYTEWREDP